MHAHICSPTILDLGPHLPWEEPLSEWHESLCVTVPRGISRNLVRFIVLSDRLLALKEVPERVAEREYQLLRGLNEAGLPVVQPVALLSDRGSRAPFGLLVTQFLEFCLPYRMLFSQSEMDAGKLLDSMVQLLVRLHLGGFYWGDCSLSNTLFLRDAGGFAAYLVDAETGELHDNISDGMRLYDVGQAQENIAGELLDLAAQGNLPESTDPFEIADAFATRYHLLWAELNRDEVFARDESFRIASRVKMLNELGYHVEEVELFTSEGGHRVRMRPRVVEHGYHRRRLHNLTGLQAEQNQSIELLNDLQRFHASHSESAAPLSLSAYRWLTERYQSTLDNIPQHLRRKLTEPEIYVQILEHRWLLSEAAQCDVGRDATIQSYLEAILAPMPDRVLITT